MKNMGLLDIFRKQEQVKNEIKTMDLSKYENMSDEELKWRILL